MKNELLSKTKKLIRSFLFLFLFAVCFSGAQAAQAEELVIGSLAANNGDSISVPIVAGSDFTDITDMTLFIDYDDTLLSYQSYTPDQLSLPPFPSGSVNEPVAGDVRILWFYSSNGYVTESFSEGDVLMYLNFDVISADNTTADVAFSFAEVNPTASLTPTDGVITLNAVTDPLVGYWKLDEGTGTLAGDSSIYGNDGEVMNETDWTTGAVGNALDFDGVNDYVEIPHSSSLDITEEITVMAWVNETVAGPYSKILAKRNGHYYFYFIGSSDGQLYAGIGDGVDLGEDHHLFAMTNKETTLGTGWHHVAFTFSNDGNLIKLYKDGVLAEEEELDHGLIPFEGLVSFEGLIEIGANDLIDEDESVVWQSNFGGKIDEVKIYNRVLAAGEIESEYEAAVSVLPVITLLETTPIDVELNSIYLDAGATAFDNIDGDITENIVIVNSVNTAVLGTYTVTYDVSDTAGNPAIQVVRTVNVVETAIGDSLILYLNFDEGSGTAANDSSTYGNHGAVLNGATWTGGQVGGALGFDGDDDLVEMPDSGSLNVTDEITIMAWVNETIPGPYSKIVSKRNGDYFYFLGSYEGQLYAGIGDGPVGHHTLFGMTDKETTLGTGWHHVAFTFNNTDKTIKLYMDGVNAGEDEVLTQSLVSFNGYVQIGANRFANEIISWPSNFGGKIDEVKIYNRVLSDGEIASAAGVAVMSTGGGSFIPASNPIPEGKILGVTAEEVLDGDIIQCKNSDDPFAVYIVKTVGDTKYIRHIVSLEIFDHYEHLKWEDLKQVDSLSGYSLSGWVRVNTGLNGTPAPTDKVYEINGDQTKHWINMTAEDFLLHGGSEDAIFSINQGELDLYALGADVMAL